LDIINSIFQGYSTINPTIINNFEQSPTSRTYSLQAMFGWGKMVFPEKNFHEKFFSMKINFHVTFFIV